MITVFPFFPWNDEPVRIGNVVRAAWTTRRCPECGEDVYDRTGRTGNDFKHVQAKHPELLRPLDQR